MKLEDLQDIRHRFLTFMARGLFTEVMQSDHYHMVYKKWVDVFEIEAFFKEVNDEIRALYEFHMLEHNRKMTERFEKEANKNALFQTYIGLISIFFVIPSLVLAFLGLNIEGLTSSFGLPFRFTLASFAISLLTAGGVFYLLSRYFTNERKMFLFLKN